VDEEEERRTSNTTPTLSTRKSFSLCLWEVTKILRKILWDLRIVKLEKNKKKRKKQQETREEKEALPLSPLFF